MSLGLVRCSTRLDLGHDHKSQSAPTSPTPTDCSGVPCFAGQVLELAQSAGSAKGLAIDKSNVFWAATAGQALMVTPKDGSPTRTTVTPNAGPYGVAVDDRSVYFTTAALGGYVGAAPRALPPVIGPKLPRFSLLVQGEPNPQSILIATEAVYFADESAGTLKRVSFDGSLVETLATGISSGCELGIDYQLLYYTDSDRGEISTIDRESLVTKRLVAGLEHPAAPLPRGDELYFLELGTLAENYGDGRLLRVSRTGGAVEVLLEHLDAPRGLAADLEGVYVCTRGTAPEYHGRIVRLGDDGVVSTLATDQPEPFAIAVDDEAVYWTADAASALRSMQRSLTLPE